MIQAGTGHMFVSLSSSRETLMVSLQQPSAEIPSATPPWFRSLGPFSDQRSCRGQPGILQG